MPIPLAGRSIRPTRRILAMLQNPSATIGDHRPTVREISKESIRFMNTLKRSTVAAIVGLAIAASAALAATPTFPEFGGPPSKGNPIAKPTRIIYSGDGSQFFAGPKSPKKIGKLKWTTWSSTAGATTGYQWINNCDPACADGTFALYPVKLNVSQPKQEGKYFIFTRLKVTYTGKKPGHKKSFTWPVSYSHGFFNIG